MPGANLVGTPGVRSMSPGVTVKVKSSTDAGPSTVLVNVSTASVEVFVIEQE